MEHTSLQHFSPLLSLPPELRNSIYRLVFKSEGEYIEIEPSHIHKHDGILQTCRQIREEGAAIFYAENTFISRFGVGSSNFVLAWLSAIGRRNVQSIRGLVITFVSSETTRCLAEGARGMPYAPFASGPHDAFVVSTAAGLAQGIVAEGVPPYVIIAMVGAISKSARDREYTLFVRKMASGFRKEVCRMVAEEMVQHGQGTHTDDRSSGTCVCS